MGVYRKPPVIRRRRRFFFSRGPQVIEASATDGLEFVAAVARRATYRPTAADILDALESTARRGIYRSTATDGLDLAGAPAPRRILRASVVESVGLAGTMSPRADYRTSLADLLDLIETVAAGGRIPAEATDALDVTDGATPGYIIRRAAVDTWQLLPAVGRSAVLRATAADALDVAGVASYPAPADSGEVDIVPDVDGTESSDTTINLTNTELPVRSAHPYAALEFHNPDVPQNAIIVPGSAKLQLYVVTADDPGLTIKAHKTASPATLSTTNADFSGRTPLTSGVEWNAANIGVGAYKDSPDIGPVLEEVFALPEWTRGSSDLVLLLINNGTGGYIRFHSEDGANPPRLVFDWYVGGLTITATAADTLALLDDAARQAIVAAATSDALSLAAATATAVSLLVADALELSETVLTLARLAVGDALLLSDGVYLTYAMSLTEPVAFHEAINRIAAVRAQSVDAVDYVEAVQTRVGTTAGDAYGLTEALDARRILAALAVDALRYTFVLTGDIAGILEAIATDALDLSAVATAGWRTRATAADAMELSEGLAAVRRLLAGALDAGAIGDVAALLKRARATAQDAAEFADALRSLMRTRAADTLDLSDEALGQVAFILHALAADVLELTEATTVNWRVTARDRLEFAATVAAIMHWVEAVQDTLGLSGVAVFLLPNGIVRIELAIKAMTVQFDVAMPRVAGAVKGPRVDIEPHGLQE